MPEEDLSEWSVDYTTLFVYRQLCDTLRDYINAIDLAYIRWRDRQPQRIYNERGPTQARIMRFAERLAADGYAFAADYATVERGLEILERGGWVPAYEPDFEGHGVLYTNGVRTSFMDPLFAWHLAPTDKRGYPLSKHGYRDRAQFDAGRPARLASNAGTDHSRDHWSELCTFEDLQTLRRLEVGIRSVCDYDNCPPPMTVEGVIELAERYPPLTDPDWPALPRDSWSLTIDQVSLGIRAELAAVYQEYDYHQRKRIALSWCCR